MVGVNRGAKSVSRRHLSVIMHSASLISHSNLSLDNTDIPIFISIYYRERRDIPLGLVQPLGQMVGRGEPVNMIPPDRGERNDSRNMHNVNNDASLMGVGGDVRNAFGGGSNVNMGK